MKHHRLKWLGHTQYFLRSSECHLSDGHHRVKGNKASLRSPGGEQQKAADESGVRHNQLLEATMDGETLLMISSSQGAKRIRKKCFPLKAEFNQVDHAVAAL